MQCHQFLQSHFTCQCQQSNCISNRLLTEYKQMFYLVELIVYRHCYCNIEDGHKNIQCYTVVPSLSHGSWHGFEQAMWDGVGSHSRVKLHTKNQVVRTPHTPPQLCSVQLQRVHALLTSFLRNSAKDGTRLREFTPCSVHPARVGLFTPELFITQSTGLKISGTIYLFYFFFRNELIFSLFFLFL